MVAPKHRDWSQQEVLTDFNVDKEGNLIWATGRNKNKKAGWKDVDGYILIRYKGYLVRAHNLVWLIHYGIWPDFEIDHINNNPSDNLVDNLRKADRWSNRANQKLQIRRFGKFKGVHKNGKAYRVKIKKCGKQYNIGSFDNELEAAMTYNLWAKELFGEFANFNLVFEDAHGKDT